MKKEGFGALSHGTPILRHYHIIKLNKDKKTLTGLDLIKIHM